jgi:hypothetical protein
VRGEIGCGHNDKEVVVAVSVSVVARSGAEEVDPFRLERGYESTHDFAQ